MSDDELLQQVEDLSPMSGHQEPEHPDVGEMTDDEVQAHEDARVRHQQEKLQESAREKAEYQKLQQEIDSLFQKSTAPPPQAPLFGGLPPNSVGDFQIPKTPPEVIAQLQQQMQRDNDEWKVWQQQLQQRQQQEIQQQANDLENQKRQHQEQVKQEQAQKMRTSPHVGVSVATDESLGRRCKARPQPPPFPPPAYLCTPQSERPEMR